MLKNVLDIKGVTILKREQKRTYNGGDACIDAAWNFANSTADYLYGGNFHAAMDFFYTRNCTPQQ